MPIFDQGYQHWSGQLSGHAWRWLAITRRGVRVGLTSRLLRIWLLVAWLPALVLAVMLCMWGLVERNSELVTTFAPLLGFLDPAILAGPRPYRVEIWTLSYNYFLVTELRIAMILILLVGPNLISQDLRYNALPLYLSRPLRRVDYFLGKLGVIVAFLGAVIVVPSIVAYVLGLLFSLDLSIVRDTIGILMATIAYGMVIALSAGMLILAISSLSRNSRYVSLCWLGIWFVSSTLAGVLQTINHEKREHLARREGRDRHSIEFLESELEDAKHDWRPLVSYTANLSRVGQQLLGTDACWEKLAQLQPAPRRSNFLYYFKGAHYPWYWSAAVLAALFILSACILNLKVTTLDRLK
jgi:ABC-2 type transport system permease protein